MSRCYQLSVFRTKLYSQSTCKFELKQHPKKPQIYLTRSDNPYSIAQLNG